MRAWRALRLGDKVSFHWNDFDGYGVIHGKITKVCEDHVIATFKGNDYWLDEDNQDMFSRGWV